MAQWDERYGGGEFVYGTAPNDFLVAMAGRIPPGRVLCLAEGQGRNAAYLAGRGFEVTGVDSSAVGLEMARQLAASRGVTITTVVADLAEFDPGVACWEGVVSIFAHLPAAIRRRVLPRMARALRPGGLLILEAYAPAQIGYGTGGPSSRDLLASLDELRADLDGLVFQHAVEIEREVVEGRLHTGRAAVVQIVATAPESPGSK